MRFTFSGLVAGFLLVSPSVARAQKLDFDCANTPEATALRQAPAGVSRPSKDTLIVNWAHGRKIFADSGLDYMSGRAFWYCGYYPRLGFHVIGRNGEKFGALLLNHATGALLPAGELISFSPDGSQYLALVQNEGWEYEQWFVYAVDGSLRFKSAPVVYKFGKDGNDVYGLLDSPHWSSRGQLTATLTCGRSSWTATLIRSSAGTWSFSPACKTP